MTINYQPRIDLRNDREIMVEPWSSPTLNIPLYDTKTGAITGRTQCFLDMIGATREDVSATTKQVMKDYAIRLFNADLEFCSTKRELKNGTLVFRQVATKIKDSYFVYKIYANGQIRQAWTGGGYYTGARIDHYRLKSPQPFTYSTSPLVNLIETYSAAMSEMFRKYDKKISKMCK